MRSEEGSALCAQSRHARVLCLGADARGRDLPAPRPGTPRAFGCEGHFTGGAGGCAHVIVVACLQPGPQLLLLATHGLLEQRGRLCFSLRRVRRGGWQAGWWPTTSVAYDQCGPVVACGDVHVMRTWLMAQASKTCGADRGRWWSWMRP